MNINAECSVGAIFQVNTYKQDGTPVFESSKFKNIVTDVGLQRMHTNTWGGSVAIGSGNNKPTVHDATLQSWVKTTSATAAGASDQAGVSTSEVDGMIYWWARRTYRFAVGTVVGNVSEIGMCWQSSGSNPNVWNRTLIKDTLGNPTTITVLEDEYIDVVVEVRVYVKAKTESTFNVVDRDGHVISTHNVTLQPVLQVARSASNNGAWWNTSGLGVGVGGISGFIISDTREVYKDDNVNWLSWAGAGVVYNRGGFTMERTASSIVGSRQVTSSEGNTDTGHSIFQLTLDGLMCNGTQNSQGLGFKCLVTPPIPKESTFSLTYRFRVAVQRHVSDPV